MFALVYSFQQSRAKKDCWRGKEFKTKETKVNEWLAQTSQQLLALEQRILEIRENSKAMPCSWRLAVPLAMPLEQDLLHQTDFFLPAFSISCGSFSYCFSHLFLQVHLLGLLAFVNSEINMCPQRISCFVFPLYSAVNLYLLGEGVNSQGIDSHIYLNNPQKNGLEMEIRERNSHPYSPSNMKYLKGTNSKAEANPLATQKSI